MRRILGSVSLVLFLPLLLSGQSNDYSKGHGYAYFAPGIATGEGESISVAHIGGGGEGFFSRNVGAGADVGYLAPFENFGDGIGTFSPNIVGRFRAKSEDNKVEPFITGGYTLFFRSGTANGFNFGGGTNWWFSDHVGLRFELRDNVWTTGGTLHHIGIRIGVTFR